MPDSVNIPLAEASKNFQAKVLPSAKKESSYPSVRQTILAAGGVAGLSLAVVYRQGIYRWATYGAVSAGNLLLNEAVRSFFNSSDTLAEKKEALALPVSEKVKTVVLGFLAWQGGVLVRDTIAPCRAYGADLVRRLFQSSKENAKKMLSHSLESIEKVVFKALKVEYKKAIPIDNAADNKFVQELFATAPEVAVSEEETKAYVPREALELSVIAGLCKREAPSTFIVGRPGTGKSSIAAGVALRFKNNEVAHPSLRDAKFVAVSIADFYRGKGFRINVIAFAKKYTEMDRDSKENKFILYFDELNLGNSEDSKFFINALKPLLAKGNIHILACTTPDVYEEMDRTEEGQAFLRRFSIVKVEESAGALLQEILRTQIQALEKHHECHYPEAVIQDVLEMTKDMPGANPAKAVRVLDAAGAQAWVKRKKTDTGPVLVTQEHLELAVKVERNRELCFDQKTLSLKESSSSNDVSSDPGSM